jgi:hypothetical protein
MTLMEYTVTPTAETLKRTRKTIKINTKNTLDLYDDNQTPEVFTDIDNYNDYNLDNDQENYPGWGSNPQGVSINVYDTGWAMNNWYGNNLEWRFWLGNEQLVRKRHEQLGLEWYYGWE